MAAWINSFFRGWLTSFFSTLIVAGISNYIWGISLRYAVEFHLSVVISIYIGVIALTSLAFVIQSMAGNFVVGLKAWLLATLSILLTSYAPVLAFEVYANFTEQSIERSIMYSQYYFYASTVYRPIFEGIALITQEIVTDASREWYLNIIGTVFTILSAFVGLARLFKDWENKNSNRS